MDENILVEIFEYEELFNFLSISIFSGLFISMIVMILGLAILGLINIFKKIY